MLSVLCIILIHGKTRVNDITLCDSRVSVMFGHHRSNIVSHYLQFHFYSYLDGAQFRFDL